ncbi:hypothetical protein [Bacillus amyloliquefaciens]|jgi:hypothetical protein|uniref:hypothetical protein n=1 Tax=Bacillus amyloliquefaciens TaxID=1390 RepID=UPI0015808157|nr:hypothetical protein [Bacillus amyloliquefaciens]NUI21976.1 hypothetical protein [Bacillus amyloliquefaciens]NUI30964.1 hypothetical protein [Bacillus amyloliquefaciens]NUI34669.1 hypothetical protein [Bacillus amyloliquefaciens]NUI68517.1 hypothetical protein [Bacillus amyloliquefaciens]NUI72225.1 hypothetical protein [Bacillus amyloliquefaciens]
MRYRTVIPFFLILFVLSSCSVSTVSPFKKNRIDSIHHTQILFFSDENHIDKEVPYYDAILDLEKKYPHHVDQMKVYDNRKGWEEEINTFPALMVINHRHVVMKIEGSVKKKEDIIKPMQHVLAQ